MLVASILKKPTSYMTNHINRTNGTTPFSTVTHVPSADSSGTEKPNNIVHQESQASPLYSYWEKFGQSAYTFFSYIFSCLTGFFTHGSFTDVTRHEGGDANQSINSNQKLEESGGVEISNNELTARIEGNIPRLDIIKECERLDQKHLNVYSDQKGYLDNHLTYLRDHLRALICAIENKPEPTTRDGNNAEVSITEITGLLDTLKKINNGEYASLAEDIEKRCNKSKNIGGDKAIFSPQVLLEQMNYGLEKVHARQQDHVKQRETLAQVELLQGYATKAAQDASDLIHGRSSSAQPLESTLGSLQSLANAFRRDDIQSLVALNAGQLGEQEAKNRSTQLGLINQVRMLQNDIEKFGKILDQATTTILTNRAAAEKQKQNQEYQHSPFRRSRF